MNISFRGGGERNVSLNSTSRLLRGPSPSATLQPLSANFSQNANPSNMSPGGGGVHTALILQPLIVLHEPPPLSYFPPTGLHKSEMPLLILDGGEKPTDCIAGLLSNVFSTCLVVFKSAFLPVGHLQTPSLIIYTSFSPFLLLLLYPSCGLCSPVRGWRGWAAAWRVPSGCWRLSSCPVCSPPAPPWHWDRTLGSRLATVEEWVGRTDTEVHQGFGQIWNWSQIIALLIKDISSANRSNVLWMNE